MTPLEAKISALLVDSEKLIEPMIITAQKWVIVSDTQKILQTIIDEKTSLSVAYGRATKQIRQLHTYEEAKATFERDKVFSDAQKSAGYYGTFEGVLQYLITCSAKIIKNSVRLNHTDAIESLKSLRNILSQGHLEFEATTRLIGVTLTSKYLDLPDGVKIYKLNRQEKNDRQPLLQLHLTSEVSSEEISNHPAELRISITVPVDHSKGGAFFSAKNNAVKVANEIFGKILQAIFVASSGKAMLGATTLKGGIEQLPTGRPLSREWPPPVNITLRKSDLTNIAIAYDIVSGGRKGDKTLSRALHRFILGRQRTDLVDKLVDYVISWEAILLTQSGNPIAQELSYRFALNGASLVTLSDKNADPHKTYKKMKSAYSARSTIVHGGDDKERDRALQAGEFKNVSELCDYLESNFRCVVFWLASNKPKERPYRKDGGWEALLW